MKRRLRRCWWRRVRHWHGELCDDCGRRYWPVVWRASDADWLAVTGRYGGLLCPACFSLAFERLTSTLPIWRPGL